MKINFTKRQYRDLLRLMYLGEWMVNAFIDGGSDEFEDLGSAVYPVAGAMDCGDWITRDPKDGRYDPTQQMDKDMWQDIENYNEETFWAELIERLAKRDFSLKFSEMEIQQMTLEDRFEALGELEDRYQEEFEKNGLRNLQASGIRPEPGPKPVPDDQNTKASIYQIQVALKDISPSIWRRILISSDTLLPDLHKILQTSMGWTNSHLHQFIQNDKFYQKKNADIEFWDDAVDRDYSGIRVCDVLKKEKDSMIYEYDFGDGWIHNVVLQKILPADPRGFYPAVIDGKMKCPPEDIGGPGGFMNLKKILSNPKHKEHKSYLEWLGGPFDPAEFNLEEVNELLRESDFGCLDLSDD